MRFTDVTPIEGSIAIGWVKKAHNLKGEIFVQLFNPDSDLKSDIKTVLMSKGSEQVEHEVVKSRLHKNGLILLFKGFVNRNQSEAIKGWQINLPMSDVAETEEDEYYLFELIGYQVVSPQGEVYGVVKSFMDNTLQDLVSIESSDGNEFSAPYVDQFIVEVIHEDKKIIMDLPPGINEL